MISTVLRTTVRVVVDGTIGRMLDTDPRQAR